MGDTGHDPEGDIGDMREGGPDLEGLIGDALHDRDQQNLRVRTIVAVT